MCQGLVIKHTPTLDPTNSTPRDLPRRYENICPQKDLYSNVHSSSIHNNPKLKTVCVFYGASLVAQTVKNPPAMQETLGRFLGWEDPLEEGMATHSSILAGESPGTEEPGGLIGSQRVGHDWVTKRSTWRLFFVLCIYESVFILFCWFWILDSTYKWGHVEFTCISLTYWGFPGGSDGKESTCNADDKGDRVWSLGGEDPLEKEMATHSSTLAWRILWTEEPGGLQSIRGVAKSQTWLSDFHFHFSDLFHLV